MVLHVDEINRRWSERFKPEKKREKLLAIVTRNGDLFRQPGAQVTTWSLCMSEEMTHCNGIA